LGTYAFGELSVAVVVVGLPLPGLCADRFGVAEADVRCAGGEVEDGEGAMSIKDDLSRGAGDGAIAIAVLMLSLSEACSGS
jgi:hypothetical protein